MKKRIFTIMAIFALSICTACGSGKKDNKKVELSNLTAYDKPEYSISLPKDWSKTDNDNASLAFLYKSSKNDYFTENITAIVQDLSTYDYTLDTYKELSVSQYEELGYTIEECEKVTINENDCYSITSYSENDDKKIYCKQVFTLINKKAYLFTFAAEKEDFNNLLDEVDAIFDTITFNEDSSSESVSSDETSASDGSSEQSDVTGETNSSDETSINQP